MSKNSKDILMEALERVILHRGFANVTIDSVAAEAEVSKGCVLHHFPTKNKLIEALIERNAQHWRDTIEQTCAVAGDQPGDIVRSILNHALNDNDCWSQEMRTISQAIFAALAQDPELVKPMQDTYKEVRERLKEDGLPEGVAEVVISVLDGLWFTWVLGISSVGRERLENLGQVLNDLIDSAQHVAVKAT